MDLTIGEINEELQRGNHPAIVVFTDERPSALFKHVRIQNNGWVHTQGFDEAVVDYAPGTIECVENAKTEMSDSSENFKPEIDADWFEDKITNGVEVV